MLDDDEYEEDIISAAGIVSFFLFLNDRVDQHNSILSGSLYFNELMQTENESRFLSCVRMNREDSFIPLIDFLKNEGGLKDSLKICVGQKIMIFIHILVGHTNSQTKERWQHSGQTISKTFHEVKNALLQVKHLLILPPKLTDEVSKYYIQN